MKDIEHHRYPEQIPSFEEILSYAVISKLHV